MSDTDKEVQADLDDAQADLEKKVAQLKHVLQHKVETVERPFQWAFDHLPQILIGAGLAIAAISLLRGRSHRSVALPHLEVSGPITRGVAKLDQIALALRDAMAQPVKQ